VWSTRQLLKQMKTLWLEKREMIALRNAKISAYYIESEVINFEKYFGSSNFIKFGLTAIFQFLLINCNTTLTSYSN